MTEQTIRERIGKLRERFFQGATRSREFRIQQLQRLRSLVVEHEHEILQALHADVGKPRYEAWLAETGYLVHDIDSVLKHLSSWMKPEEVSTPLPVQPAKSYRVREPLGVVLVIGPWNYPVQLLLAPLVGALAAGNCVALKPSELTPHCSALMARLIAKYFDPSVVCLIEGGVAETTALLEEPFDHVFFTGSTQVGKIVMAAAAKHLTPVTLELGGKSPCIVDEDVDLDVAAARIAWGKFFNAGQTCVAPDYVLVHASREQQLIDRIREHVELFYGPNPKQSPDFARIVNERHFQRLSRFLRDGEVVIGGETDVRERYIAPTVLRGVKPDSPVMGEEIFGPILPILTVTSVEEAIRFVTAKPKPLALYIFSNNKHHQQEVIQRTSSGGLSVNDTWMHLAVPELPFGGVGPSGMGAYHGKASFDTFSHIKSVLEKATWIDPAVRYPPYTEMKFKLAKKLF